MCSAHAGSSSQVPAGDTQTCEAGAAPCAFLLNWIMKPSSACAVLLASCSRNTARAHKHAHRQSQTHSTASICGAWIPCCLPAQLAPLQMLQACAPSLRQACSKPLASIVSC